MWFDICAWWCSIFAAVVHLFLVCFLLYYLLLISWCYSLFKMARIFSNDIDSYQWCHFSHIYVIIEPNLSSTWPCCTTLTWTRTYYLNLDTTENLLQIITNTNLYISHIMMWCYSLPNTSTCIYSIWRISLWYVFFAAKAASVYWWKQLCIVLYLDSTQDTEQMGSLLLDRWSNRKNV